MIARLLSAALFLTAPAALAARTDLPLAASLEVMGRSIVYGVQVDRALNERWAVGLGFSRVNVQSSPDRPDAAALLFPLHANYYLSDEPVSWFTTAGLTPFTNSENVEQREAILGTLRFSSLPILLTAGAGIELRQQEGFLFRLQGLITRGASTSLSTGFHLGYCF